MFFRFALRSVFASAVRADGHCTHPFRRMHLVGERSRVCVKVLDFELGAGLFVFELLPLTPRAGCVVATVRREKPSARARVTSPRLLVAVCAQAVSSLRHCRGCRAVAGSAPAWHDAASFTAIIPLPQFRMFYYSRKVSAKFASGSFSGQCPKRLACPRR